MTTPWKINSENNNCYAYALDQHNPSATYKLIPGDENFINTCGKLIEAVHRDRPEMYPVTTLQQQCEKGYRKIYMAVSSESSEENRGDFHFWRQEPNYYWTHKLGISLPSHVDADGKPIHDPQYSNNSYTPHDYNISCGFYCISTTKKQE